MLSRAADNPAAWLTGHGIVLDGLVVDQSRG
jgi:hypothetical protein